MRRYGVIYQKQKREAHDIFQPDGQSRPKEVVTKGKCTFQGLD